MMVGVLRRAHLLLFIDIISLSRSLAFQTHKNQVTTRDLSIMNMAKKKKKKSRKKETDDANVHSPLFCVSNDSPGETPPILPKLLVFDLDNTLWTPELYQIRTKNNITPNVGTDIRLFPGAHTLVADFASNHQIWKNTQFAIASRTDRIDWAEDLLNTFEAIPGTPLSRIFPFRQIVPGSKRKHFQELHATTKVAYNEMVFFDDDAHLNLREIETMGVLCCHCPKGMNVDLFRRTLWHYSDMKKNKKAWMGITVSAKNLPKR